MFSQKRSFMSKFKVGWENFWGNRALNVTTKFTTNRSTFYVAYVKVLKVSEIDRIQWILILKKTDFKN